MDLPVQPNVGGSCSSARAKHPFPLSWRKQASNRLPGKKSVLPT